MAVEFGILGDVQMRVDSRRVPVGYAQLQGLLAVLLVDADRPVPVDRLLDRVWGTRRLPRRPRSAIQHGVSLLRRALAAADLVIEWSPAGYRLGVHPQTVDLHRFHELAGRAGAAEDDDRAADVLRRALGLWRGDALAGLDSPWFDSMRATLAQQRLAAQLDLADVQLRRGRHTALLADLADWAGQHPLDERLAGQYLLALYRSGRQADALEHFERVRRRLAEQLGADPSPALRLLHRRILTADPTLAAPEHVAASVAGTSGAPAHRVPPRQLPANPRLFTGRDRELARLTAALDGRDEPGEPGEPAGTGGTVVSWMIGGVGGIGKTWLALRWAHQHLDRFPDGQLHVNLRGFDPTGRPVPAETALRGFLDALGVSPAAVPVDPDAQAALYRSLVAGRRMVILLDNASDVAQVEPLLPGSPTCTVLVTSRHQLTGLVVSHGTRRLDLDVLTGPQASDLFAAHAGRHRVTADAGTVADLLAHCAGLPLAISVVAARAGARPDLPLAALADGLSDHTTRLDAIDGGDPATNLRAVLSWSYRALPTGAARAFELLGLADGPDLSLAAAASLTALPAARLGEYLHLLERAYLVHQHQPGRYRMHDLVRLYAAEQAADRHSGDALAAATRRLVDFYLHTAFAADRLLSPDRDPIRLGDPEPDCHPQPLPDASAALAWCTGEHANLMASHRTAVDRGWYPVVWQLAWALNTFQVRGSGLPDALTVWRAGLAAADRIDDLVAQRRARQRLGHVYTSLGRPAEAIPLLQQALRYAEQADDLTDRAHTHAILAWTWSSHGDDLRALEHAKHSLRLTRGMGLPVREAYALNQVGWYQARLGDHEPAHAHCSAALVLFRRHPNREGAADTLDSLGYIAQHAGRPADARQHYQDALALFGELGYTYEEANTLDRLGQVHHALGEHDRSRTAWRRAARLYRNQLRRDDADRIRRQLDALDRDAGPEPHG